MLMTIEHVASLERITRELVGGDNHSRRDYLLLMQMLVDVLNKHGSVSSDYLNNKVTMLFAAVVHQPEALLGITLTDIELAEARYILLKTCFDEIYRSKQLTGQELSAAFRALHSTFKTLPQELGPSLAECLLSGLSNNILLLLFTLGCTLYGVRQRLEYLTLKNLTDQGCSADPENSTLHNQKLEDLNVNSAFFAIVGSGSLILVMCISGILSLKKHEKMSRDTFAIVPTLPRPDANDPPYATIEEYVKAQIQEQQELIKARKKARKDAERNQLTAETAETAETPEMPAIAIEAPVIVHAPELGQRALKENARLLAERKKQKEALRQQRRFGMFDSRKDAVEIPKITTLQLTDMEHGDTVLIDISPGVTHNEHSNHFEIQPYKFILADQNPALVLSPAMRRLLHANQSRGFIGEVSPGQTGLKYFKEGFVVLKAFEQERVLCAIKSLYSNAFEREIDFIVPIVAIANHQDYERTLQRQNTGAWLRGLLDARVLIEEDLSLTEATAAAP